MLKIIRRSGFKCFKNTQFTGLARPTPLLLNFKKFHYSPVSRALLYADNENNHVYNILQKLPSRRNLELMPVKNQEEFEAILNQNWRLFSASEIVKAFKNVVSFCQTNNIKLSDSRFDKLVDGLMDNCEYLTDEEILDLIYLLVRMPPCTTISEHNFSDVWSCLDDICCWKVSQWDLGKQFLFADAWFHLKLAKLSDYVFEVLERLCRKAGKLTKDEILRFYFYSNISRKRSIEFDIEDNLAKLIDTLNVDELAVVALGYFKSQTKVKLIPILKKMVKSVTENSTTIHELTLAAILKLIRFNHRGELYDEYVQMLDKLVDEIPRLSLQGCLHIALIGTGMSFYHEKTLNLCCEKIITNIESVRLKEIERILLATSMFNFDPKTSKPFYQTCFDEIHKTSRWKEIVKFNRCIPAALNYLAIKGFYSHQLTNHILNDDFIEEVYGKQAKLFPNELLCLDAGVEIELENYTGERLRPHRKYKAAKWLIEYVPTNFQKKLTISDKILIDVVEHVEKIVGKDNIHLDHILPHFCRCDIILCEDKNRGFIEPFGFQRYILGDIKRPFLDSNINWYALIVLLPNLTMRDSDIPIGWQIMKARQLKKLGYNVSFVEFRQYSSMNDGEKINYLLNKIKDAKGYY